MGKWVKVLLIIGGIVVLIIGLIIGFIYWMGYSVKKSSCTSYLEVPVEITISGSNLKISPLDSYSGQPKVFVYSYGDINIIPENCSINSFHFSIDEGTVYDSLGQRVGVRESGGEIREEYPKTQSYTFKFKINEPNNKAGELRKSLLLKQEGNFYFKSEFRPFAENKQVYYKEYKNLGCLSIVVADKLNISLKDIYENAQTINPSQVICVKEVGEETNTNIEGCSFFEASSDVTIKTDILENLAIEREYCRPIF